MNARRAGSRSLRLGLFVVLALLVAGCRLEATVDVTVGQDGSGQLDVELAVDPELEDRSGVAGLDLPGELVDLAEELHGWEATLSEDGRRVRLTAAFADTVGLEEGVAAFAEGLRAAELQPLEPLDITVDGREITIRGAAGLQPSPRVTELGLAVDEATALLAQTVEYRLGVHLPGELVTHNGDAVGDDGRVVWVIGAGERVELHAHSEQPLDLPLGMLALAAGAVGLILLVAARRLRASHAHHPPVR